MNGIQIDTSQIRPVSDFIRNHKAHIARLKETHASQVLTVNGRAEVVLLDAETFENLISQLQGIETVASVRNHLALSRQYSPVQYPFSAEEIERRHSVVDELMIETQRLGLTK